MRSHCKSWLNIAGVAAAVVSCPYAASATQRDFTSVVDNQNFQITAPAAPINFTQYTPLTATAGTPPAADSKSAVLQAMLAPSSPLALYMPSFAFALDGASDMAFASDINALISQTNPISYANWRDIFDVARIGEFEVPLRSDPAERTNILLSAQAIDNVLIAPGEVFSFNDVVGERTPERGFQDGWMFDNGKLIRGTGGGICVIATGVYNAALRAGLEPVERHAHSGLVSYAPPGCDAAVVYGVEDLKFRNTTDSAILVRTLADDDRVVVALFGATPPEGYKVEVESRILETLTPKTIEKIDPALQQGQTAVDQKPKTGFVVKVDRYFTENGKVLKHDVIASECRPARDKIVRVPVPVEQPAEDVMPDIDTILLTMG